MKTTFLPEFCVDSGERRRLQLESFGSCVVWLLSIAIILGPAEQGLALQGVFENSRQVTLFGILATPDDDSLDPKLKQIGPQLRRLFPNHGIKLLGVDTQRMHLGQTLPVSLGNGYVAQSQLMNALDVNGRAQLRLQLDQNGTLEFATLVTTPLHQLFFIDKRFPDGKRLVLGIGIRP